MQLAALSDLPSGGTPVFLLTSLPDEGVVGPQAAAFAASAGFKGRRGSLLLVPGEGGSIACALYGVGRDASPMDCGKLPRILPAGDWRLAGEVEDAFLASLGWLLGAYRFDRYRAAAARNARLVLPAGVDRPDLVRQAGSIYLARDLVNTPTSDLGPAELEQAIREVAADYGAQTHSVIGDALLEQGFPMVHAVGRASAGEPRIIDMQWGDPAHPKVTLVGKGVCFDTGGLNIKPGDSMALMKKDMGGAANTLALARMIMDANLPVRLRLIVPAVENSISANAFRPGDVLRSRKGISVEIGNTDAEGRLILGDALAWGDEEAPDLMIDMATLTGAARVALGPDLPAVFANDDALAGELADASVDVHDPLWRLPLWPGYRKMLHSEVADCSHISRGGLAGAITAALFLQKFVESARSWVHVDLFAWVNAEKPWATIGGEAQAIRAIFRTVAKRYPPR